MEQFAQNVFTLNALIAKIQEDAVIIKKLEDERDRLRESIENMDMCQGCEWDEEIKKEREKTELLSGAIMLVDKKVKEVKRENKELKKKLKKWRENDNDSGRV